MTTILETKPADTFDNKTQNYLQDWARRTGNLGNLANYFVAVTNPPNGPNQFQIHPIADLPVIATNAGPGKPIEYVFISCGIPFIQSSNGTMGNNGAISGLVAMPATYNTPGAWLYCPANQINGSNAAGWYWFVGASTSAGQIYQNTYTSGVPTAPATLVPFSNSYSGTFTALANGLYTPTISIPVPGGTIGPNGKIRCERINTMSNTANTKVTGVLFGGTTFTGFSLTTTTQQRELDTIWNAGEQNANVGTAFTPIGVGAGTFTRGSVNTAIAQTLSPAMGVASGAGATDFVIQEYFSAEILFGA